jgi:hypothetical protein
MRKVVKHLSYQEAKYSVTGAYYARKELAVQ